MRFDSQQQNPRLALAGHHGINWANPSSSLGYWLSEDAQKARDYDRGVSRLHQPRDVTLKLNRMEIRCAVENRKSRSDLQRLAFRSEGTIRQAEWLYNHFVDYVVYGMLASESGRDE